MELKGKLEEIRERLAKVAEAHSAGAIGDWYIRHAAFGRPSASMVLDFYPSRVSGSSVGACVADPDIVPVPPPEKF